MSAYELEKTTLNGQSYYIDVRLNELRAPVEDWPGLAPELWVLDIAELADQDWEQVSADIDTAQKHYMEAQEMARGL